MFHGYGSNKSDLFSFSNFMDSDYLIISIQAPIKLDYNSYCWWSLQYDDNMRLTMNAEEALKTVNLLDEFISTDLCEKYNFISDQIYLVGFSQGCMITLQTGLKRKDTINSVIGYSGRIIDTDHLSKNINSRPNIILMHGDIDQVVSIDSLLEAKEFFGKNNYEIQTNIFKNCEHRIPTEGSSLGLQFIKKHFNL